MTALSGHCPLVTGYRVKQDCKKLEVCVGDQLQRGGGIVIPPEQAIKSRHCVVLLDSAEPDDLEGVSYNTDVYLVRFDKLWIKFRLPFKRSYSRKRKHFWKRQAGAATCSLFIPHPYSFFSLIIHFVVWYTLTYIYSNLF